MISVQCEKCSQQYKVHQTELYHLWTTLTSLNGGRGKEVTESNQEQRA